MTPRDRPDLPLAEEPSLGLRPVSTGTSALGRVQPVNGPFPLEEEPALWPAVSGAAPDARPGTAPRARSVPADARAALPATGAGTGAAGAVLLLSVAALGWRARRLNA